MAATALGVGVFGDVTGRASSRQLFLLEVAREGCADGKRHYRAGQFAKNTGDTVFDEALRRALSVELEQSRFLRIIPEQPVQQTLRLLGKQSDARLTP